VIESFDDKSCALISANNSLGPHPRAKAQALSDLYGMDALHGIPIPQL
jgi:hypothetical protein